MELGKRIAKIRRSENMTQKELAERAGISINYLSRIEIGSCPRPHVKTIARIAKCLGVELELLLKEM
ncbi:helix-turn-helix domain-containing protein [Desulfosporosinus acididurans]|uniref:helix-turn-helix domain-containing protein n=1 Tax=Desulfosporosinus acididurans TaxID=476652 RepID=UPI000649455F|nr:helix-turn-helix transcriptional regulator [Desulfosporosinus acididurans]